MEKFDVSRERKNEFDDSDWEWMEDLEQVFDKSATRLDGSEMDTNLNSLRNDREHDSSSILTMSEKSFHSHHHIDNLDNIKHSKKRKRKYYLVHEFSVLFKNDIRRRYPIMFINVLNQNESLLLDQFYAKFSHPQCRRVSSVPAGIDSLLPKMPASMNSTTIVNFAALRSMSIPDGVVQLLQSNVKRRKDREGCRIDMDIRMKGTILYELPTLPETATMNAIIPQDIVYSEVLMNMPIEVSANGVLALELDAQHRIVEVSLNCTTLTATPVYL